MADGSSYEQEMARLQQQAIARADAVKAQVASGQLKVTKELTSIDGRTAWSCTATICDGSGKPIVRVEHFPTNPQESLGSLGARVLAAYKKTQNVSKWFANAGKNISGLFSFSAFTLAPAAVGYAANAKDASNPTKLAAMVDEVKRLGLTPEQVMLSYPGAHVQIIEVLRKEVLGMEDA
ncbi:MAG: hypothetical protein IPG96_10785 [Proteobacteria bacterium]|nr:hypothetical protein [Pseudomonadota bacterium]